MLYCDIFIVILSHGTPLVSNLAKGKLIIQQGDLMDPETNANALFDVRGTEPSNGRVVQTQLTVIFDVYFLSIERIT
jgi:hypothetical protein